MHWLRTWVVCLLLASQIAFTLNTGHAEELPTPLATPAPVVLTAGQAAPYDGILLTRAQAEEAVKQLAFLRLMLEDFQKKLSIRDETHRLTVENMKRQWEADDKAKDTKNAYDIAEYRRRLELADNPPFYKTGEFNRLIGLILGIAVGIAAGGI